MRVDARRATGPLVSLAAALAVSALVALAAHANPVAALTALVGGALGSPQGIAETLVQTTSLLLAGLGVAFAFRGGLFNIGAEGQLTVGALFAAVVGASFHLPGPLEVPLCLIAGALAGAAWAGIAGVLRARFGASEVITTIMLNYIAFFGANYLVDGMLRGSPSAPETALIAPSAMLAPLIPQTRLTLAFPLALGVAALVWFVLSRTVFGYEVRAVGASQRAARYAGIDVGRTIVATMAGSGALAGLAGACEVLGLFHRFNAQLSSGYGFESIAVALLANSDPLGVIVSSVFFGILHNGALSMQALAGVPKDLISVLEGFVILFAAANLLRARALKPE